MTQAAPIPRVAGHPPRPSLATDTPLSAALSLAARGLPVLPLRHGRDGKAPVANCPRCTRGTCGGRPNMLSAGPCRCLRPCHAWAAATTDLATLTSHGWAPAWRTAVAVAYHPGGAGLTVVDLDSAAAVEWARQALPATRVVPTTRGEHWIYRGSMPSANSVLPDVDVKSLAQYTRWRGPGTGTMVVLPDAVRRLVARNEEATPPPGRGVASSSPAAGQWSRTMATGCRHTETYVRRGLATGTAKIRERTESGASSRAYGVARFIASQHARCPGPCDLATITAHLVAAAVAVGVPEVYAARAVARGLGETS
ncbi:bifunctional DNA primase/polymerase [Streptomyces buecherae]|uniref:bifunctional DNA primase/polymerase n=1 Tax=Streptomyces buecherae TaxID=2763006 RepID=UPI0036663062